MKEKITNHIHKIYGLRDLTRYNNSMHIKDESVAEHLAFVTLIVLELNNFYNFDLQRAMVMAITHDLSEIYVTDVPHNVKRAFPKIGQEIKEAEYKVFREKFGDFIYSHFAELEGQETVEAKIVHLADVLSCIQYATSEIKLGNEGYMKVVLQESEERAEYMMNKLKDFSKRDER